MLKMKRLPGDDIRGVGPYHSRVVPATEADFDRLAAHEGHPAPWHSDPNAEAIPDDQWGPVLAFLHRLARMPAKRQAILFGRLLGLSFEEIGDSIMGGKTKQAAEQEFSAILSELPALKRAFPETRNQDQEQ